MPPVYAGRMLRNLFSRKTAPETEGDDGDMPSVHRAKLCRQVSAKLARNPLVTRIESPQVEIYARRDFLTHEECAQLCAIIDRNAQPSKLFSGTQGPEYRTSYSAHMGDDDAIVDELNGRISAMMGIAPENGEPIQGQRYIKGQEYRPHCDYFPVHYDFWEQQKRQGGQRCWTAMIYLSDVASGGETSFVNAGFKVPPVIGTVIIWNNLLPDGSPNPDTQHCAKPVEDGVKYIVTKWYRERAWVPKAAL